MKRKNFSKSVSEFYEKFQGFYTFYNYQQKLLRIKADEAQKKNDVITSNIYSHMADEFASLNSHVKLLITDFENLIVIGKIK